jgi:transcriptional regulator with XRE-family HTH domain
MRVSRRSARRALRKHIDDKHGGVLRRFAEAHGFNHPLVSMWLSGKRTPGPLNAHRLEAVAGIPWTNWLSAADRRAVASPT